MDEREAVAIQIRGQQFRIGRKGHAANATNRMPSLPGIPRVHHGSFKRSKILTGRCFPNGDVTDFVAGREQFSIRRKGN